MQGIKCCIAAIGFAFILASPGAYADVITEWNLAAPNATGLIGSPAQARALATAHGAAFEAANAIQPRYAVYLKSFVAPPNASPDAAAASAMHVVLSAMVPAQRNAFDDAYKSIIAKIPDGEAK